MPNPLEILVTKVADLATGTPEQQEIASTISQHMLESSGSLSEISSHDVLMLDTAHAVALEAAAQMYAETFVELTGQIDLDLADVCADAKQRLRSAACHRQLFQAVSAALDSDQ